MAADALEYIVGAVRLLRRSWRRRVWQWPGDRPLPLRGVVREHHWPTNQQFVDAVSVALLTPGPVVITAGFIGFLVAGLGGACVAALGTFLPTYAVTVLLAPAFKRYGRQPGVAAFVQGVTAAAVGAITGAVMILGRQSVVDLPTAVLAVATLGILLTTTRVPEPLLVLGAALIGVLVYPLVHHWAEAQLESSEPLWGQPRESILQQIIRWHSDRRLVSTVACSWPGCPTWRRSAPFPPASEAHARDPQHQ